MSDSCAEPREKPETKLYTPPEVPEESPMAGAASFAEIRDGILPAIPNWQEAMLFASLVQRFTLGEFKGAGASDPKSDQNYMGALRVLLLIEKRENGKFSLSETGRRFVKWLIKTRLLTPLDATQFVIKFGPKYGRRIVYDALFGVGE